MKHHNNHDKKINSLISNNWFYHNKINYTNSFDKYIFHCFLTKAIFYPRNEWRREKFKKKFQNQTNVCQMNQNFDNLNEQCSNEINQISTPLRARNSQSNIYTTPQVTQSQETILESFMPSSSSANCDRKRNSLIYSNYFFSKI